ncbi:MAG: T9SS type A sorting domain-containing protein [Saprospiraceae bacterium]|nr:T9SS type A sorting domain-containing protein [Saprospiraceae bacterium]
MIWQCAPVGSRSNDANQKIISSFTIFPNPASELIQLNGLDQYPISASVQVTDIYGKVLINNSITKGNTMDIHQTTIRCLFLVPFWIMDTN